VVAAEVSVHLWLLPQLQKKQTLEPVFAAEVVVAAAETKAEALVASRRPLRPQKQRISDALALAGPVASPEAPFVALQAFSSSMQQVDASHPHVDDPPIAPPSPDSQPGNRHPYYYRWYQN
jgi:hypothetical protein